MKAEDYKKLIVVKNTLHTTGVISIEQMQWLVEMLEELHKQEQVALEEVDRKEKLNQPFSDVFEDFDEQSDSVH